MLNGFYWVLGSTIGGVLGNVLPFDLTGIEFSLTALFVTIFLDQWKNYPTHLPALLGLTVSIISLLVFGPSYFLLPALLITVAGLIVLQPVVEHHA
jgi:4-azaleucine resistance transporter AzlC